MNDIWVPPTEFERNVLDIEPTTRTRQLPDGRVMSESRLTISREWMEQMWQGYRCAACLEDVTRLGAFPKACPLCGFPIRDEQRRQLQEDYVGERPVGPTESLIDREEDYLARHFHKPKVQIIPKKDK